MGMLGALHGCEILGLSLQKVRDFKQAKKAEAKAT
jgi:hypothetical protein